MLATLVLHARPLIEKACLACRRQSSADTIWTTEVLTPSVLSAKLDLYSSFSSLCCWRILVRKLRLFYSFIMLNTFSLNVQREDCLLILFWVTENSAWSQKVGLTSMGGFISADNSSLFFSAFSSNLGHSSCGSLWNCGSWDHFLAFMGEFLTSRLQLDYVQIWWSWTLDGLFHSWFACFYHRFLGSHQCNRRRHGFGVPLRYLGLVLRSFS